MFYLKKLKSKLFTLNKHFSGSFLQSGNAIDIFETSFFSSYSSPAMIPIRMFCLGKTFIFANEQIFSLRKWIRD